MNLNTHTSYKSYNYSCIDNNALIFKDLSGYLCSGKPLTPELNVLYNAFEDFSNPLASYNDIKYGLFNIPNINNFILYQNTDSFYNRVTVSDLEEDVNGLYIGTIVTGANGKYEYVNAANTNKKIIWTGNKWTFSSGDKIIYESSSNSSHPWTAGNWSGSGSCCCFNDGAFGVDPKFTPNKFLDLRIESGKGFFNIKIPPTGITTGFFLSGQLNTLNYGFSPCIENKIPLIINYSGIEGAGWFFTGSTSDPKLFTDNCPLGPGNNLIKKSLNSNTSYNFLFSGMINLKNGINFTISNPNVLPIDILTGRQGSDLNYTPNSAYDPICYLVGKITGSGQSYVNSIKAKCLAEDMADSLRSQVAECDDCKYTFTTKLKCPYNSITNDIITGTYISKNFIDSYKKSISLAMNTACDKCYYMITGEFYTGDQLQNLYNWSNEYCNVTGSGIYKYGEDQLGIERLKFDLLDSAAKKANLIKCLQDDQGCCENVGCETAYIGFGASTSLGKQKHEILGFSFKNIFEIRSYNQDFYKKDLILIGNSYISGDNNADINSIVLTDDVFNSNGNFYFKKPIKLRNCDDQLPAPFNLYFKMKITPNFNNYGIGTADGMSLIFQAVSNLASGQNSGMGYKGINNSIALSFDTYTNTYDWTDNSVSLNLNGIITNPRQFSEIQSLYLADGDVKHVWVDYETGYLKTYININNIKPLKPILERNGMNFCEIFPNC